MSNLFPEFLRSRLIHSEESVSDPTQMNHRIVFPNTYYKLSLRKEGNINTATVYHPTRDDFIRATQSLIVDEETGLERYTLGVCGFFISSEEVRRTASSAIPNADYISLVNPVIEVPTWCDPLVEEELKSLSDIFAAEPTTFLSHVLYYMESHPDRWFPMLPAAKQRKQYSR